MVFFTIYDDDIKGIRFLFCVGVSLKALFVLHSFMYIYAYIMLTKIILYLHIYAYITQNIVIFAVKWVFLFV